MSACTLSQQMQVELLLKITDRTHFLICQNWFCEWPSFPLSVCPVPYSKVSVLNAFLRACFRSLRKLKTSFSHFSFCCISSCSTHLDSGSLFLFVLPSCMGQHGGYAMGTKRKGGRQAGNYRRRHNTVDGVKHFSQKNCKIKWSLY